MESAALLHEWPEPVVPVQSIAESGASLIPECYVKPPGDRPAKGGSDAACGIPVVDLRKLAGGSSECRAAVREISEACREWGFFQAVNHGVDDGLLREAASVWRDFFALPVEEKRRLANSPRTYEGYGSRLGVEKGATLDWGDYFYLHLLPHSIKNYALWPPTPTACREVTEEFGRQMGRLCETVMMVLSIGLGLDVRYLQDKFGGEEIGTCMRVNYYPKCPQPELTLGLSAHSDPGGLTVLLVDDGISGLQVQKGGAWVKVNHVPRALIVNVGDQIQVLSNATYKSVEHRVMANALRERFSIAFFYNPKSDLPLEPARELVTQERPQLYRAMTFNEYRLHIRKKGPTGKAQVESLQAM